MKILSAMIVVTLISGCNASGFATGLADGMSGRDSPYSNPNNSSRVEEALQGLRNTCRNAGGVWNDRLGCLL